MKGLSAILVLAILLATPISAQEPQQKPAAQFAVSVKTTAPWQVAYQKFVGPYSGIRKAVQEVFSWVAEQGLVPLELVLSEYYNTPLEVDSTKLEWAIMVPVLEPSAGFPKETKGEASIRSLDPIQVAYTYHRGPYREIGSTYQHLFGWVYQNGYQVAGPVREIFWSNPDKTPKEK
ncbi:MAG: GyrI-like domain-containing protein [bacterium]